MVNGNVELIGISKIYTVLDSVCFVSDGEIAQIHIVSFGEVLTQMCSSGLASEFQRA
jgi:hypothetical protein